jgi:hypothetical protein
MTVQINSNYLEKYAEEYAAIVCERYYSGKQFITGQDIIQLTSSIQVNFFVIKRLFELWQEELNKLKSNPYFDYRDISVHEALTQFMNVLSRRIKVEKGHLQPLVKHALMQSVQVATDPVSFYQNEIDKAPSGKINEYLKENKKYYKWNAQVISFLIDKAGFGHDESAYKRAIAANYQVISENLESVNLLIATLGDVKAFDLDAYLIQNDTPASLEKEPEQEVSNKEESSFFDEVEKDTTPSPETPVKIEIKEEPKAVVTMERPAPSRASSSISASELKHRFSAETYRGMKGVIGELSEGLAINQRFMFTKELFDGNADLLSHALKSIDNCNSFDQAIELINQRYVSELGWEGSSEEVQEFLQLVYRRFLD